MAKTRPYSVLTWLCLIWFGLANTLLGAGMVVCRDAGGGARVEWGCSRGTSGECLAGCGADSDHDAGEPDPCKDTPLQGEDQIAKAPPRAPHSVSVPSVLLLAVLSVWDDAVETAPILSPAAEPERPPDALRHIRTVVLVV